MRRRRDLQVQLYSATGDPESIRVKAWLSGHGVPFSDYDIGVEDARRREMLAMGFDRPPVTVIGARRIQGYKPEEMAAALEEA
ncbi:MAG: glutaredoxin family protein [Firmicutes bacterium]|nr:glutaredoxin family protein [Bacillota bacterium]